MTVDLSAHTMVINNKISKQEAEYICKLFGKSLSKSVEISGTDIKIAGFNQINLNGSIIPVSKQMVYDIYIKVNLSRLIKKSNVSMLILDKQNVKAVIQKLDDIFANRFCLKEKHCRSSDWHMKRFDCGIDLKLCTDEEGVLRAMIKALHDSFDSNNSRGVQYSQYKGHDAPEVQYESIALETAGYQDGTPLYKYNIYYKYLQLVKYASEQGLQLMQKEIEEIINVIRIEKQIDDVSKVFRCSNKLGSLLNEDVTERVMESIVKEIKLLFGVGDYLPYEQAVQRIYESNYDIQIQNKMTSLYIYVRDHGYSAFLDYVRQYVLSHGGTEEAVIGKLKEVAQIRKQIEALGISVASVQSTESIKGINTVLAEELKKRQKPRKKGSFGKIRPIKLPSGNIRYQCNATLHNPDGTTKRYTLTGKVGGSYDEADYEILCRLRSRLKEALRSLGNDVQAKVEYLRLFCNDLINYQQINHSPQMQEFIASAIQEVQIRIRKGETIHEMQICNCQVQENSAS